jgi:hypothetical protein
MIYEGRRTHSSRPPHKKRHVECVDNDEDHNVLKGKTIKELLDELGLMKSSCLIYSRLNDFSVKAA